MYKEGICYILFRIAIFFFFFLNVTVKKTTKRKFKSLEINYIYIFILKFLRALPPVYCLFLRTLIYSLVGNSSSARL